jgi:muramoyltetrapeptide carboxypeptidase LdcA involved in peptidoglycan recycling
MLVPRPLRVGDSIGIVAPGRKLPADQLQPAINFFTSLGLHVKLATHIFSQAQLFGGNRRGAETRFSVVY